LGLPVRFYCTYFDVQYLSRGLALYGSLRAQAEDFRLFVLCLDDLTYDAMAARSDVVRIRMCDFERQLPELAAAREDRSLLEYYYTCTPALIGHVFTQHPEVALLTYLDADLYFFSSPEPLFAEIGEKSVGIIEHRFPEELRALEEYGRFNVGWVTFAREEGALRCLERWRGQCLEWCYDRVEPGRFGDQKYLDEWPRRFDRVVVLQHKGANVAPWNVSRFKIENISGRVFVDEVPLIFYHFHGLRCVRPGPFASGLSPYAAEMTPELRRHVYHPYLRAVLTHRREQPPARGPGV
jgi:hypothetical protein